MTAEQQKQVEAEIIQGLMQVRATDPEWIALIKFIEFHIEGETDAAIFPNLSSEARHYNAGRAGGAKDFKELLLQKFNEAQKLRKG